MKKHKNLYEQIYDFENLYQAYLEARKNKRYRDEVLTFTANLEENLIDIQNHLIYQTYEVGRYSERFVHIPKTRLIMALPFRDRVVQWAVYRIVQPLFVRSYIYDSYGSLKGGGVHSAVKRLQYWLRLYEGKRIPCFVLKMDIAKFFFRIPHEVLMKVLRKKIGDERLLWLFERYIKDENTPFGYHADVKDVMTGERLWGIGMPVGNLLSQMMANAVLNELDQYMKRELRVKHYIRYMDDIIILGADKAELRELMGLADTFLADNLGLSLNPKSSVRPASQGIEFVGFRVWNDKLLLKRSLSLRMKRNLRAVRVQYANGNMPLEKCRETLMSYMGMMSHCTGIHLRDSVLDNFVLVRKVPPEDYPE